MAGQTPEIGDKASWDWNGSTPSGEVAEKKTEGEVSVQSKRGNTIKKDAKPNDPAIALSRSGNDVVKNQSELQVEEKKADGGEEKSEEKTEEAPKEPEEEKKTNGEAAAASPKKAEKRKAEEPAEEDKPKGKRGRPAGVKKAEPKEKAEPKKKAESKKAEPKPKADGEKSRGRPKGSAETKKADKPKATPTGIGKRTRSGGK